jgi:hypothetical protein
MAKNSNIDLNGLRKAIDESQAARNASLGITEATGTPKDFFLNSLLKSRESGQPSHATKVIELLAEKKDPIELKNDYRKIVNESPENVIAAPVRSATRQPVNIDNKERDEKLFENFGKKSNKTMAESIAEYASPEIREKIVNSPNVGTTSANIEKLVAAYLAENLEVLMEDAINTTMLEMYSTERIKKGIKDNREFIRSIVIEVIREFQVKQKDKVEGKK